ncbi:MAG: twin-arginine translocation signal domain-containing protein [candidate division NC10 bacterium]|nr:twin-arginine translocation signal domain-containing protein [candidate division NC10 bacterium]
MKRGFTRREFLKASAQGAGVAGLTTLLGGLGLPVERRLLPPPQEDPAVWIDSVVREFTLHSPLNSLQNAQKEKAWDEPLVGFSRGDDPLYQAYKEHVGPFHWTPLEAFQLDLPEVSVTEDQLAVISWILPQTEATKADHRKETIYPSERWARSRVFGEEFNNALRRHVAARLSEKGFPAIAPCLSSSWKMTKSGRYGFASTWSERHAAYASGLGTFGLSDGLITPKGKAMRCGSVVAKIQVPATPRPYQDHHAYCLYFSQGRCGACAIRCPAQAISKEKGHDKVACEKYLQVSAEYVNSHFGFKGYGCGLCQVRVPCESKIPV